VSRSTVRSASRLGRVGRTAISGAIYKASVVAVAGGAAAALVVGCSAGQIAQTAGKQSAIQGVNTDLGPIKIRNAYVEFPATGTAWEAGSDVPLSVSISNEGATVDELVSVSSELGQVRLVDPSAPPSPSFVPAAPTATPSGGAVSPTAPASPSVGATPTSAPASPTVTATPASPSAPASPSTPASPTASPSAAASLPLAIPPGARVGLVAGGPQLVLTGVREEITPGTLVPVTMIFRSAGEVTVNLPLGPPPTPLPRESLTHDGESEAEGE
jgi:copper(I)-binding protein